MQAYYYREIIKVLEKKHVKEEKNTEVTKQQVNSLKIAVVGYIYQYLL